MAFKTRRTSPSQGSKFQSFDSRFHPISPVKNLSKKFDQKFQTSVLLVHSYTLAKLKDAKVAILSKDIPCIYPENEIKHVIKNLKFNKIT